MTLALAMMMILLISVMGAGILTFASRDLNTVTEENRGQRAFELADAGVAAAKSQLLLDCGNIASCKDHYDGGTTTDYQWSAFYPGGEGVTLNDLDGDGNTWDCVNVKISATGTYDFKVVSTGYYHSGATGSCVEDADAKRKIEAKLHGETGLGGGGGGPIINPGYYTRSDILIAGNLSMAGESLFTEGNIVIAGLSTKTRQGFQNAASTNSSGIGDPLGGSNTKDPLKDWYSPELSGSQPWNTVRRLKLNAKDPTKDTYNEMGFAAQGKICSPISSSALTCIASDPSVADGVFGYDSTTGKSQAEDPTLYPCPTGGKNPPPCATTTPLSYSNHKAFIAKDPPCSTTACPDPAQTLPQDQNTISYPFPRVRPDPKRLFDLSHTNGNAYWACPNPAPSTCSPPWTSGTPHFFDAGNASQSKVVFVDAKGNDLTFSADHNSNYKGVLVVWCGTLRLDAKFSGIILTLYGDGTSFGGTDCHLDPSRGRLTIAANNQDFSGWMYANGGSSPEVSSSLPGLTLEDNTKISPLPSGSDDLANIAFGTTTPSPPQNFSVQGWRELYQD